MFENCRDLTTIYASERFVPVSEADSERMFSNCVKLVGRNGTAYDADHIDAEYARIDTADAPGYFTPALSNKQYRINSIIIESSGTNQIPAERVRATLSVTKLEEAEDAMILLASYSADGRFIGEIVFARVKNWINGGTFEVTVPLDNRKGNIAFLKAFVVGSFSDMTPLSTSVSFPSTR